MVSAAYALTGGHVDVFVLSLETRLRSLACADAGNLDGIHGPCSFQKPYRLEVHDPCSCRQYRSGRLLL